MSIRNFISSILLTLVIVSGSSTGLASPSSHFHKNQSTDWCSYFMSIFSGKKVKALFLLTLAASSGVMGANQGPLSSNVPLSKALGTGLAPSPNDGMYWRALSTPATSNNSSEPSLHYRGQRPAPRFLSSRHTAHPPETSREKKTKSHHSRSKRGLFSGELNQLSLMMKNLFARLDPHLTAFSNTSTALTEFLKTQEPELAELLQHSSNLIFSITDDNQIMGNLRELLTIIYDFMSTANDTLNQFQIEEVNELLQSIDRLLGATQTILTETAPIIPETKKILTSITPLVAETTQFTKSFNSMTKKMTNTAPELTQLIKDGQNLIKSSTKAMDRIAFILTNFENIHTDIKIAMYTSLALTMIAVCTYVTKTFYKICLRHQTITNQNSL